MNWVKAKIRASLLSEESRTAWINLRLIEAVYLTPADDDEDEYLTLVLNNGNFYVSDKESIVAITSAVDAYTSNA